MEIEKDELGNTILNGEYLISTTIEQGSYGKIKLARHITTGELYAIKIYNKTLLKRKVIGIKRGVAFDNVQRELAILRQMNHKNVVKLHEVIDDPEDDKLYLIMEYVKGGPTMKIEPDTQPLPEETAKKYFCDIVNGLEYLHSLHVAHRDIKPDNLLVADDGTVKICDFSVSQSFEDNDDRLTYSAGSPVFLSPELCEPGTTPQGRAADIWALGVCLYCFIFGTCPFLGNNIVDIYQKIRNDEIKFPRDIPPALADLLHKLLTKNPKQRITISEIKDHPWVRGMFPKKNDRTWRRRR